MLIYRINITNTSHPVDEVPTPLDGDTPTLSSICDRDDLDSEYIIWNGDVTIDDLESLEGIYAH